MNLPCDAITILFSVNKSSNVVLLSATTTPRTILYAEIQDYGGTSYISDGGTLKLSSVAGNYVAKDDRYSTYKTKNAITAYNTTATAVADGQIIYVDRDIASTTEPVLCSPQYQTIQNTTNNISGTASTTYGFTYGEIINSIFLFLIFATMLFTLFILKIRDFYRRK
jgi:large-conductance mechanosensitive channel